jgi:hypothetical protein
VERILKLTIEAGLRTRTITPKQMQGVFPASVRDRVG